MMVDEDFRTIWLKPDDPAIVQIIDQRRLPHEYDVREIRTWQDGLAAIRDMAVRGAPLIGATAAWSLYLAALHDGDSGESVRHAARELLESRPTAVNLRWAVDRILQLADSAAVDDDLAGLIRADAEAICNEDIEICLGIGRHGLSLLDEISHRKGGATVNVLTHCNAGALATINWGTATAPVYLAHQAGMDIHVWVDETRPRNQGSQLTAWELARNGVPHTLIVDNAGGHLMQHGQVDIVITGTDRTTRRGDVANKIGTYLKALAAFDNGIPFYVALPSTTIDWSMADGVAEIPIEQRDSREVTHLSGVLNGIAATFRTTAP
ncbi:MAG: S-methyl-5-thioribose-1-phosphate isomerase, partial [Gammaproteobacteria bacterium]|nr:S-methyl-5-thioribose-1-phosphate isomerase [Gammaproteobacteria bacterium]